MFLKSAFSPWTPLNVPGGLHGKDSAYNAGDLGSIPGSEKSPVEGNGYPLQCACLEWVALATFFDCLLYHRTQAHLEF